VGVCREPGVLKATSWYAVNSDLEKQVKYSVLRSSKVSLRPRYTCSPGKGDYESNCSVSMNEGPPKVLLFLSSKVV
jgi:hypothetical protein